MANHRTVRSLESKETHANAAVPMARPRRREFRERKVKQATRRLTAKRVQVARVAAEEKARIAERIAEQNKAKMTQGRK